MSIYDLINPSFQVANEWAKTSSKDIVTSLKKIISERNKEIAEALKSLRENSETILDHVEQLNELERFNIRLIDVGDRFLEEIRELIQINFFGKWRDNIKSSLKIENPELTESITQALETKITQRKPPAKLLKSLYRFNYSIREYLSRLKNPETTFYNFGRQFNIEFFIDHFITLQMGQFIYEEWLRSLDLLLGNNSNENTAFIQFKNIVIQTNNFDKGPEYWNELKQIKLKRGIDSFLDSQKDLNNEINVFENSIADRLNEFYYKLIQGVSEKSLFAGSYLLPASSFSPKKTNKTWSDLLDRKEKDSIKRTYAFKAQIDNWQKDIELNNLQLKAAVSVYTTRLSIQHKMDYFIGPKFREAREDILKAKKQLEANEFKSLSKWLQSKEDELSDQFQANYTRPLLEFFDASNLPSIYTQNIDSFKDKFDDVSEKRLILYENGSSRKSTISESQEILFKQSLLENVFPPLVKAVNDKSTQFKSVQESCARDLLTLSEVIEFNLKASLKLSLKKRPKESHETALKGLERALTRIDDVLRRLKNVVNETSESYEMSFLATLKNLESLFVGPELRNYHQMLNKKEKRFLINSFPLNIFASVSKKWSNPKVYIINSFQKREEELTQGDRPVLIKSGGEYKDEQISRDLLTAYGKILTLPYIYQQLFSAKPLEDERLFIGREKELEQLNEAQKIFQDDHGHTVAVVGEKGSGKTSTLNIFTEKYELNLPVKSVQFSRTTVDEKEIAKNISKCLFNKPVSSFEELNKQIQKDDKKHVVVLDDIHNLFLREIDGFEALEKLLLLISKTGQKIFWLVTCDQYSWDFLDRTVYISRFFSRVMHLEPFDPDMLKHVILRRHQITGFGLFFEAGKRFGGSRMFEHLKTEAEKQEFLSQNFFYEIEKAANGNIRIALLLWLNSTIGFKDNDLRIGFRFGPDPSFLYQLGEEEYFTLAAFAIQDFLTSEQHANVFHISNDESHQKLEKLRRLGILDNLGDNYSIHPFLYPNIIKTLKIHKMIY